MLAIISFTILGIWTAILGFLNNTDWREYLIKESNTHLHGPSRTLPAQEPEAKLIAKETSNRSTEISEAFKNLWHEIVCGT